MPIPSAFQPFPPLEMVTSPTVTTEAAAFYMNRAPQTLRCWSCNDNGPIKPLRIGRRLAWPVKDLRALLSTGEMGSRHAAR